MLRQIVIMLFLATLSSKVCAEEPLFERTTEWEKLKGENRWTAYYGEASTDNVVHIFVQTIDGKVIFETNDECPGTKKQEGMRWEFGQKSAVFTTCDGKSVTLTNLPVLERNWAPFPPEVVTVLKKVPEHDGEEGEKLLAGKSGSS